MLLSSTDSWRDSYLGLESGLFWLQFFLFIVNLRGAEIYFLWIGRRLFVLESVSIGLTKQGYNLSWISSWERYRSQGRQGTIFPLHRSSESETSAQASQLPCSSRTSLRFWDPTHETALWWVQQVCEATVVCIFSGGRDKAQQEQTPSSAVIHHLCVIYHQVPPFWHRVHTPHHRITAHCCMLMGCFLGNCCGGTASLKKSLVRSCFSAFHKFVNNFVSVLCLAWYLYFAELDVRLLCTSLHMLSSSWPRTASWVCYLKSLVDTAILFAVIDE